MRQNAVQRLSSRALRTVIISLAAAGIVVGGSASLFGAPAAQAQAELTQSISIALPGTSSVSRPVAPTLVLHGAPGIAAASYLGRLAAAHPVRLPFSGQERAAAQWLVEELTAIGFTADQISVQEFDRDSLNETQSIALDRLGGLGAIEELETSQNVVVRIAGSGDGTVILGAGYDTFNPADFPAEATDGANVSVLLEAAQHLNGASLPYTVYLSFFGANSAALAGSHHFYNSLPESARNDIRLVANLDAIGGADTLFFTADVCDGGERCEERSEIFAGIVNDVAERNGSDVVLFKDEDFEFLGDAPTCPCCIFGVPTSIVGVPVVNFFAFDFAADDDTTPTENAATQTAHAMSTYQTLIQALIRADLTIAE